MSEPHNPNNLTNEQVDADSGWRLLDEDEIVEKGKFRSVRELELWDGEKGRFRGIEWFGDEKQMTYRTKLSRAELRTARGLAPEQPPSAASETDKPAIVTQHESMERYNAGYSGMPHGPCQCVVCKLWRELSLQRAAAQEQARALVQCEAQRDLAVGQCAEVLRCVEVAYPDFWKDGLDGPLSYIHRSFITKCAKELLAEHDEARTALAAAEARVKVMREALESLSMDIASDGLEDSNAGRTLRRTEHLRMIEEALKP